MYYLANTTNNKKVIEQDGQYYCEFDGKLYDSAVLRYIASMKVADFTKECWVNVFNDEVTCIFLLEDAPTSAFLGREVDRRQCYRTGRDASGGTGAFQGAAHREQIQASRDENHVQGTGNADLRRSGLASQCCGIEAFAFP